MWEHLVVDTVPLSVEEGRWMSKVWFNNLVLRVQKRVLYDPEVNTSHVCESHVVLMWERQGFLVTPEIVESEWRCLLSIGEWIGRTSSSCLVCLLSRPGVTAHNFSTDRQTVYSHYSEMGRGLCEDNLTAGKLSIFNKLTPRWKLLHATITIRMFIDRSLYLLLGYKTTCSVFIKFYSIFKSLEWKHDTR